MKPFISVIIPVYNVEKYLARCLDSVFAQNYPNMEIICINDGSTDSSKAILEMYVKKYASVLRVISQENQGLSAARNRGIKEAKGEWLLFVDSDDYIAQKTLATICPHITSEIDLICWGAKAVAENGENIPWLAIQNNHLRLRFCGQKEFTLKVARKTPVTVWNKLFRADIVRSKNIDFPVNCLFEDNGFYWKYFPFCRRAYFIPESYYFYTQRQQSIMGRLFNNQLPPVANGSQVGLDIIQFYQRHHLFKKYEKELQRIFLSLFFLDFDHVLPERKNSIVIQSKKILEHINWVSDNKFFRAILSQKMDALINLKRFSVWKWLFSITRKNGHRVVYVFGRQILMGKGGANDKTKEG